MSFSCWTVLFYDASNLYVRVGAKYHKASDTVRVILRDGSIRRLSTPSSVAELTDEGQEMCQYVSEVCCSLLYHNQLSIFCLKSLHSYCDVSLYLVTPMVSIKVLSAVLWWCCWYIRHNNSTHSHWSVCRSWRFLFDFCLFWLADTVVLFWMHVVPFTVSIASVRLRLWLTAGSCCVTVLDRLFPSVCHSAV